MLLDDKFGKGRVVVEDYLEGPEFSLLCFVSGCRVWPMVLSQDHKRAYDGDRGPNTGGMGAYSPLPFITEEDEREAVERIMRPVAEAMVAEGAPFEGVLYGGLMKTAGGIKVIEFNARFGDPETEVVLPRLKSDIVDIFSAPWPTDAMRGSEWDDVPALGIVLASKGYPGSYEKGYEIRGLDRVEGTVYHMGTKADGDRIVTAGGRVLFVVGRGATLAEARAAALRDVERDRMRQPLPPHRHRPLGAGDRMTVGTQGCRSGLRAGIPERLRRTARTVRSQTMPLPAGGSVRA